MRGIFPAIPNPGFEADGAGDDRPDWWMTKREQDDFAYDGMRLINDRPHGGTRCLRLLARPAPVQGRGDQTFHRAFPVHGAVAANHRYRVSVWARCSDPQAPALRINGQTAAGGVGIEWTRLALETNVGPSGAWELSLFNRGSVDADFDDLLVEDLGPLKTR